MTALKAIDVEHELPPAATPIEITGDQFQVEAPAQAVEERAKATGLDAMTLRASRLGPARHRRRRAARGGPLLRHRLRLARAPASAGWRTAAARPSCAPARATGWRPILSQIFAAGRHTLILTLGDGAMRRAGADREEEERRRRTTSRRSSGSASTRARTGRSRAAGRSTRCASSASSAAACWRRCAATRCRSRRRRPPFRPRWRAGATPRDPSSRPPSRSAPRSRRSARRSCRRSRPRRRPRRAASSSAMALFNHATKEVTAKLVYYGPGLCGKTTNLQWIHDNLSFKTKGKLVSLATQTDRTLFFDFLPVELGTIRGMRTRMQIYTVPGQVFYESTRRMVLKGCDAVVFVADSQAAMLDANAESLRSLRQNLLVNEIDPRDPAGHPVQQARPADRAARLGPQRAAQPAQPAVLRGRRVQGHGRRGDAARASRSSCSSGSRATTARATRRRPRPRRHRRAAAGRTAGAREGDRPRAARDGQDPAGRCRAPGGPPPRRAGPPCRPPTPPPPPGRGAAPTIVFAKTADPARRTATPPRAPPAAHPATAPLGRRATSGRGTPRAARRTRRRSRRPPERPARRRCRHDSPSRREPARRPRRHAERLAPDDVAESGVAAARAEAARSTPRRRPSSSSRSPSSSRRRHGEAGRVRGAAGDERAAADAGRGEVRGAAARGARAAGVPRAGDSPPKPAAPADPRPKGDGLRRRPVAVPARRRAARPDRRRGPHRPRPHLDPRGHEGVAPRPRGLGAREPAPRDRRRDPAAAPDPGRAAAATSTRTCPTSTPCRRCCARC